MTLFRRQEGIAAVEFALIAPLFALLLLSLVESGNMIRTYMSITEACREGARIYSARGGDVNVTDVVKGILADFDTDNLTTSVSTNSAAESVTVEVHYDYHSFLGGGQTLAQVLPLVTLNARTTMPTPYQ